MRDVHVRELVLAQAAALTQTLSVMTGLNMISHKSLALIYLDKAYHIARTLA